MSWSSIDALAADVKSGKTTAKELVEKALKLIDDDKDSNAVLRTAQHAKDRAKEIDDLVSAGKDPGVLAGVPFLTKDNFLTKETETTAASNILGGFNPPINATAINKLEAAGAIMVGKANLDSFAHGSSTEHSDFGATKNPHDLTRVPGGSSGGSAAAVALKLTPFALGSDTGGSIRQPASFSGVVGYKPTYGLVSRYGVVAMASSTDTIGVLANTVDDATKVMEIMSGRDEHDSTTIDGPKTLTSSDGVIKGKKFGLIKEYMGDGIDESVKKTVLDSAEKIKQAGGEVVEVSMPSLELALAAYYIIMPAEVSSNLSRYDGVRYGYSDENAKSVDEIYDLARSYGFNSEVKRRIIIGTYVLSSGYYDAYYKKAQTVRTKIVNEFNEVFKDFDYLLGPVAPTPAFEIGAKTDDPLQMYLEDLMTIGVSLAGVPAISVPAGKAGNLPIGLQIIAPQKQDDELLATAKSVEQELSNG